jgi:hypothetical protein
MQSKFIKKISGRNKLSFGKMKESINSFWEKRDVYKKKLNLYYKQKKND